MSIKFFLSCFCLVVVGVASAQKTDTARISLAANKIEPKTIAWRRDFHEFPELGNNETRTAKIIATHLKSLGLDVKEGVAKTGVVALLTGSKPGPCIALRSDIDGLPVTEKTGLPFASKVKTAYGDQEVGTMHACGHDTHMAILMSVAEVLSGMKDKIHGSIKFIFQPAEEGLPAGEEGGAPLMIKEGVMDNPKVDVIFGLHIWSSIEAGKLSYKPGAFMASSDWFTIKVKGKSAHGSMPWLGVDPITISAQIIDGLQTIVSRQSELTKAPVVITVGKFHSGVRSNIMPEEALLEGTIRTLDSGMQADVHRRFRQTVEGIAAAGGATADVSIDTKTLVTFNTPALVEQMIPSLEKSAGKGNVLLMNWTTGAEDFSYYGLKAPSFFFYLGGMKKGQDPTTATPHHTAEFTIDESAMKLGVKTFCNLVFDYMNASK